KFLDQHTCEADDENKYAQATSPWVAKTLVDKIRDHPDTNQGISEKRDFCEFGVSISYYWGWSSRALMLEKINGNYEVGYQVVPEMCRQIEKSNLSIYDKRMLSMKSFEHGVVPNVLYMIKKREERYNNYEIRGVPETQYLAISHITGKKYNVEIQKQECSYIEWQMSGVPYVHAVTILRSRREPWSRYCSPYFSVEAFKATYVGYLYPLDNIEDWPEITLDKELILPPEVTTQLGRPRKQRIRADDEMPKSKKKCAKCQEECHNSRSCDARKKGEFGKKKKRKDGPQMQRQAPPMQEDAPPMQQRKGKKSKGAQTEQKVSQQQPPPQVQQQQEAQAQGRGRRGRGGKGRGAPVQEPQAEQPPGRGGRRRGAPVQEPQAPGRGGRGRPRGGRTGRGGNGRGMGRDFSGLYGLLFGDGNVETPSTPPVNANQRAGEPLTQ
ncbi:hypothetical protein IFM89_020112, partial [Coptis chinensis]